ncbi:MAG: glycerophosphodiester phosphodiesterase family protein [Solibacillus sp.]
MKNIPIFAHRGASAYAFENTFEAFEKAKKLGATGIELDIQRTKDNEIIVFHDLDFLRLAGVPKKVAESTLQEIQQLRLGKRLVRRFFPKMVPTFNAVLDWLHKEEMAVNIEIKASFLGAESLLTTWLQTLQLPPGSHLSSFHEELLRHCKSVRPDIEMALLVTKKFDWQQLSRIEPIDLVHAHKKYYTRANLKACDEAGKKIRIYGVTGKESYIKNPHPAVIGWITDYPDKVKHAQR